MSRSNNVRSNNWQPPGDTTKTQAFIARHYAEFCRPVQRKMATCGKGFHALSVGWADNLGKLLPMGADRAPGPTRI